MVIGDVGVGLEGVSCLLLIKSITEAGVLKVGKEFSWR